MQVGVGVEEGSAPVLLLRSGWDLSPSVPRSHTPTIAHIPTRTATTAIIHPPRRIIPRRRTIPLRGAVGTPITVAITLVEQRDLANVDRASVFRRPTRA